MTKILVQLVLIGIVLSAFIYTLCWKLFFKIGKKADKFAKKIQEENKKEE
jgi:hypothetical protein